MAASAVPRLIAVVVLPTPPFWLAIASTRGWPASGRPAGLGKGTISGLLGRVFGHFYDFHSYFNVLLRFCCAAKGRAE